jgi:hypothetical protein
LVSRVFCAEIDEGEDASCGGGSDVIFTENWQRHDEVPVMGEREGESSVRVGG